MIDKPQKPRKPKHFVRDNIIIGCIAFVIMAILLYGDHGTYSVIVPVGIFTILTTMRFKKYNAALNEYQKAKGEYNYSQTEQARIEKMQGSQVNDNIAKYQEILKVKRAQAKWWQFWV